MAHHSFHLARAKFQSISKLSGAFQTALCEIDLGFTPLGGPDAAMVPSCYQSRDVIVHHQLSLCCCPPQTPSSVEVLLAAASLRRFASGLLVFTGIYGGLGSIASNVSVYSSGEV